MSEKGKTTGMSAGTDDAATMRIQSEALGWLQRLTSGEVTQADLAALDCWRAANPEHRRALAKANLLWDVLGKAAREAEVRGHERPSVHPFLSRPQGRRAFLAGAAAAGVACLAVRPPFHLWPSSAELLASYRTATGEHRQFAISSGVTVEMDTQTSLSPPVTTDRSYSLELISGQLAVSAGAERSVVIAAADGQTRADRARFNVRRDDSSVTVTCSDGSVQVFCKSVTAVLGPGQQVAYGDHGLGPVHSTDPAVITAWQRGLLIFRDVPLAQVVAEVNRYRPGRIILANEALAKRKVVAGFRIDQIDDAVRDLARSLGVQTRSLPGGIVLMS